MNIKKNKNLYCDIDSTINNHWVRIQKWALPQFPGNSIHPNAFTKKEVMKDIPIENALDSLNQLKSKYNIHYLSARDFANAEQITKEWLDKYKFPYNSISIVKSAREKPSFLKNKKVDLLIDDLSYGQEYGDSYKNLYIDVIGELNKNKINTIIFNGDWNSVLNLIL